MKLYCFLLWLCCLSVAFVQPLTAQTTVDFEGVKFDPISGIGIGYGKAFGVVESGDDEDELTLAGGFVFAITATHPLTTIVSASGEGYQGSNALFDNNVNVGGVTKWSIKKSDDANFQFKGIFLKDAGSGGSANGTVTAYKAGAKIGASVNVDFDGTLNQSFVGNPDFYDIDEVRIEAPDLNIYLDQFMAGPPYSTNVNAPAQVISIVVDGSPNSSATTMNFLVTFDKPVKNVSSDDFSLMGTGAMGIIGSVIPVSTTVYRVSIASITGEGTLKLNLTGGTNIATVTDNIEGTPPFTAGETYVVGPCSIENFDQGESDNAASFSNNGQTYQLSGNWKVRKFSPVRGINGSGFHLSGTGQDPMVWKVSTNGFKVGSFNLFLSDDASGNTLATNGTVTITGKGAGNTVFTQMKSAGFNTAISVNNGYTFIDLGSHASAVIDELEIQLGGSFQYVDLDNISLCTVFNNPAVIDNLNGNVVNFIEDSVPVLLDANSDATVTDLDSPNFSGGNMKVAITANRVSDEDVLFIRDQGTGAGQIGVSGSNVTYGGVVIGTWAGGTGTDDLVISFNVNSGPASAEALIRNLTYWNSNTTDPATAARTIAVTLNDGDGGTSTPAKVTVQIKAVNDAPTLIATAVNPTFTEGDAAVSLFSGTAISTIEAGQAISKLVFTVANVSDGNKEILKIDGFDVPLVIGTQTTGANGLTVGVLVSGVSTTVEIGKSGGVSPAIMADIVNGLTYRNTSTDPNTTNRVITLSSIQDNGGRANGGTDLTLLSIASTITIVAVNDAPVVTTSGANTTYTEGTAVVVDDALTVSDPDNTTLASATVAITGNFQSGEDILSFTNDGATMGNITAALYNNAMGVLTLSSAGATANLAEWQAALRTVTYKNSSQNPSTANRTISFKVHDSDQESVAATKTVSVIAVNDAPVNSVPGAQSVDQDATLVFSAVNNNQIFVSDVDAGANAVQVTLAATNGLITLSGTSGLNVSPGDGINVASMTLTGTIVAINNALNGLIFEPTPGYNGPASLQIATDDLGNTGSGGAQTATNTIAITVKPIIPTVVSVGASTADGTYKIGDDITLVVTFDQQVIVNTTGGVPGLLLETGAVDREATYLNGNGSKYLIFSYTVQEGDTAPDLDYRSTTALSLNGATIKNSGGNDAVLTLPTVGGPNSIAGQHAIGIDGVRPTAIMISFSQNVLTIGNTATVTITFSEPVTGLSLNNFALNNGTLSNLSTSDNIVYTATLTPTVGVNSEGNRIGLDLSNVADIAGNLGQGVVSSLIYDVHTVKPETPVAPKLSPDNDTGISREDNITNKTALGFIVDNPEGRNHNDFWNLYAFFVDGVPHSIASITTFSNANFIATLSSLTEGTHTIKTKYYDKYGNESDFSEELEVTIDLTPPIGNLSINNGAVYTNSDDVSLSFTSNEVVSHMKLSNEGNIWSGWIPFEATKQWTLFSEDGTREVYFRLQDVAGNISTIYSSHIILDTKPPIVDGVEDGKTYNTDRTITFNEGSATLNGAAFTSGTVVSAEGRYTLVVTDDAGNTTTVEFEIDKTPPAVPVNFTAIGQNGQVSLLWESNTEADLAKYILYVKRDDGSSLYVAELLKGTENFGYTGLPNGKTFEFVLIAVDQVGNRSAEALASAKTMSEQTISFATLGNLTYGQQALVLTASATSQLPVSFVSSDSNIAEVYQDNNDGGKWKVDAKKVGKVTITAAQAGNNEYLPAVSVNQLLTIVPASLTVTADAKTKVYGDADPALTYTVKASDLRNGDAVSVVSGTLTRVVGESVGSYDITNVDLAADNYTVNYEQSTLSITKANLTVTADAKTKVYGGADPALTYTVKASDLRNGDAVSVVGGTLTRAVGESVGSYDITNVDLAADNYTINYVKSQLSITKANLTVTADAKTKVYGGVDPALTYTVKASDLRNGDAVSVVGGTLTRAIGESVGSYDITDVDLAADNYTIKYEQSQLSITKANLTVTADAKTKVYGDADPALTYMVKVSDLRNGDDASVVTGSIARVAGEDVGDYDINNVNLLASNYNIQYEKAKFLITKASIAGVTFADASFVYDGTVKSLVIAGALPVGTQVSYQNNEQTEAGEYTVTAVIDGGNNYENGLQTAKLTITKAALPMFTFADASFVYDGAIKSLIAIGLPAGATVGSYANNEQTEAGEYVVTANIVGGKNYENGSQTAKLTIEKAALPMFTFADRSFVYDGTVKSLIAIGLPAGTTVGSYENNEQTEAGEYVVKAIIDGGRNYENGSQTAKLTITKASIAGVTFADASFTYDGTVKSLVIAGTLPVGTQVSYENNKQTEVGEYVVTASIDGGNNYVGERKSAKLTITKAILPAFTFADGSFVYDGTVKSLIITNLPAGLIATYSNNDHIDAGEYTVTAVIDGGKNYTGTVTKTAKLRISPLQQVLSFAPISAQYRDAGTVQLDITSNSDLPIQVFSDNLLVAEVQGASELLIKGVGRSIIRVEQAGGPNHIAAQAVEQLLEVVNDRGAKLPVRVHPAVSPNGDGINEFLRIEGIEHYPENKLVIFDGNGNVVQSFDKYDNHSNYFDGTKAGRPVPNGTYFYMLEVKVNGKWEHDKGYFVIRK